MDSSSNIGIALLSMPVYAIIGFIILFWYLANKESVIDDFIEHNQNFKIGKILRWLYRHDWIILIPYILYLSIAVVWSIMLIGFFIKDFYRLYI